MHGQPVPDVKPSDRSGLPCIRQARRCCNAMAAPRRMLPSSACTWAASHQHPCLLSRPCPWPASFTTTQLDVYIWVARCWSQGAAGSELAAAHKRWRALEVAG